MKYLLRDCERKIHIQLLHCGDECFYILLGVCLAPLPLHPRRRSWIGEGEGGGGNNWRQPVLCHGPVTCLRISPARPSDAAPAGLLEMCCAWIGNCVTIMFGRARPGPTVSISLPLNVRLRERKRERERKRVRGEAFVSLVSVTSRTSLCQLESDRSFCKRFSLSRGVVAGCVWEKIELLLAGNIEPPLSPIHSVRRLSTAVHALAMTMAIVRTSLPLKVTLLLLTWDEDSNRTAKNFPLCRKPKIAEELAMTKSIILER